MGRRKSGGFVHKRYAAKIQNTVNIISNVCHFGISINLRLCRRRLCDYYFQSAWFK